MEIDYLVHKEIGLHKEKGVEALVTSGDNCFLVMVFKDGAEWDISRHSIIYTDFFKSPERRRDAARRLRWPRERKLTSGQITKIKKLLRPELNSPHDIKGEKNEILSGYPKS